MEAALRQFPVSEARLKRSYICFGGAAYDGTTAKIVEDAPRFGADSVTVYDDKYLMGTEFWKLPEVQWLWNHRGVGNPDGGRGLIWFAWKPKVIMDALARLDDGDIVLYTDADTYPIADLSPLYEECARIGGVMLFAAQGRNNRWDCKRDCFIRLGMDEPCWYDTPAAVARFMLFQKGAPGVDAFLAEWQRWCLDPQATTFDASTLGPELPGFCEHRTEQAILSLMAIRDGHKLYREACEFGNSALADGVDADLYGQLFRQVYCHGNRADYSGSKFFNVPGEVR